MKQALKDWMLALGLALMVYVVASAVRVGPSLPEFAPEIEVRDLDGAPFSLQELRGRIVVLNFWATWCGPCKTEIPHFSRFSDDHPEIEVLGLAVDSGNADRVRTWSRRLGIGYRVALAGAEDIQAYDVGTLPTTVIVDTKGRVGWAHVGALSQPELEAAVRGLE
ncbi:MAG: TlpA disulfide reductase family protein [Myxococcota bacterium]|jgi:thiol-disulfide isomerase/thioredoxin|nr:TlpA disulfide reductase family protein [Myxococcota bacterium]